MRYVLLTYLLTDLLTFLTPASQAGTPFTYPGGMEGWVDLGDMLHTDMVYPPADGHHLVSINYVDRSQRANHYTTQPPVWK